MILKTSFPCRMRRFVLPEDVTRSGQDVTRSSQSPGESQTEGNQRLSVIPSFSPSRLRMALYRKVSKAGDLLLLSVSYVDVGM